MGTNEKRELLRSYAEERTSLKIALGDFRSSVVGALTYVTPNLANKARSHIASDYDSIVRYRTSLSDKQGEYYVAYGKDLNEVFSEAERDRGIDPSDIKFDIRSKDEIVADYLKCQDEYAYSDTLKPIVNDINNDNGYYGAITVEKDMAKDIDMSILAPSLLHEWEKSYPGESFLDEFSAAHTAYEDKQLAAVKKYIDLEKLINMYQRDADDYSKTGYSKMYAKTLENIKEVKAQQRELANQWKEEYGMDSIAEAAMDMYEEVYPDDDFEWYTGDEDTYEDQAEQEAESEL